MGGSGSKEFKTFHDTNRDFLKELVDHYKEDYNKIHDNLTNPIGWNMGTNYHQLKLYNQYIYGPLYDEIFDKWWKDTYLIPKTGRDSWINSRTFTEYKMSIVLDHIYDEFRRKQDPLLYQIENFKGNDMETEHMNKIKASQIKTDVQFKNMWVRHRLIYVCLNSAHSLGDNGWTYRLSNLNMPKVKLLFWLFKNENPEHRLVTLGNKLELNVPEWEDITLITNVTTDQIKNMEAFLKILNKFADMWKKEATKKGGCFDENMLFSMPVHLLIAIVALLLVFIIWHMYSEYLFTGKQNFINSVPV